MTTSEAFLAEIRAAAKALNLAPSTLCQRAVQNAKLVARLESGQSVTVETVERIRAFIADAKSQKRARKRAA